ncbi:unnamed protein product [Didymodactylos carnosus]|uniref:OTU domain-containing protein n=1 Tax=Didymodactylos carnosus TaxID=1234261 RepID=A0A814CAB6_9BILA|nr:unnamed protein product [Didymodactylos carnosus]CAF1297096.1 unnamed protein product [Didymodactylos carnosus]CAF3715018.1 unnamed protein product [Didymodactylos carnosus]CAF4102464.1 unnamed protein product [Didymodactylos carnosus]
MLYNTQISNVQNLYVLTEQPEVYSIVTIPSIPQNTIVSQLLYEPVQTFLNLPQQNLNILGVRNQYPFQPRIIRQTNERPLFASRHFSTLPTATQNSNGSYISTFTPQCSAPPEDDDSNKTEKPHETLISTYKGTPTPLSTVLRPVVQTRQQKSRQQTKPHSQKTEEENHDDLLDKNLAKTGYKRVVVDADGNCFFSAIAIELIDFFTKDREFRSIIKRRTLLDDNSLENSIILARMLRKLCYNEWKTNTEKYKAFIQNDSNKITNILDEAKKFRNDKYHSSELGDALPLTLANILGVRVKIITSIENCPIIDVSPDDHQTNCKNLPFISLAYNQSGEGHYDIAVKNTT